MDVFDDARLSAPVLPAHLDLTEDAWPFWRSVIDALPRASWNEQRLHLAYEVAGVMADIKAKRTSLDRSPFRAALGRWSADQRRVDLQRLIPLQLRLLRALGITKGAPRGRPPVAGRSAFEAMMSDF
jgi:hypothetical protein